MLLNEDPLFPFHRRGGFNRFVLLSKLRAPRHQPDIPLCQATGQDQVTSDILGGRAVVLSVFLLQMSGVSFSDVNVILAYNQNCGPLLKKLWLFGTICVHR